MRNQAPSGIRPSTSGDPSAPASMTQHTSIALPYDIWNEIVHLAAKDDLIQLCLVSAMVGRIATKRLYASLSLNTMVNTAKCYRTVMGSSTLAGTVTELELDLVRYPTFNVWYSREYQHLQRAPAYHRLVFRLIGSFSNLKVLRIHCYFQNAPTREFSANLGSMRPRLLSFRCAELFECSALPLLRSQSSLESLHLEYSSDDDWATELANLSPEAVPQLRSFACDSYSGAQLVRGRAVEEFSLSGPGEYATIQQSNLSACLRHLQMSSRPLRKVRLPLLGMYATSLPQIVGALPDLIELTLSVETRYGDELTHLVSAEGLEAFRRFSQLQTFEFIVKFRVHDTSIFEEEIRRACPTLQSVAVHGRESEESSDEEEWEEGDEEEDGDEEDGDEEDGEESWYDEEHLDEESLPFGL